MDNQEKINILLVDDHQMMIDGIRNLLSNETNCNIVDEANNGQVAYEKIAANPTNFALILTDISMPLLSGTELCRMIKSEFPHIQVLILSMYNNSTAVKEAVLAEADGYILKNAGKDELLKAIHRISNGGTYFSQDIIPLIYNQYHKEKLQQEQLSLLTTREREILSLIIKEMTSEEIAETLFISKKTVDNHRQHLLEKTGCKSTVGLVKFAIKYDIGQ
ncbi:response regulator transcription factor [Epilithonimonas mollis]|uniref:Two component transcriptional regulator, LuxR family n=1 Tax=Epilithonimonas mollis TaxID=216903 RepID=A0A1M6TCP8_9FLAO|nr:response regulator transcription factor [Epilithonimonas mollis]SHK54775.1 two component transcriptional regulator, LuxR family [Epilithonimonas mollis]